MGGAGVTLSPNKMYFAAVRFNNNANSIPTTYGHRNIGNVSTQYGGFSATRVQQYPTQNIHPSALTDAAGGVNFLPKGAFYFDMHLMIGLATPTDGIQMEFGGTAGGVGATLIAYTEILDDVTGLVGAAYQNGFFTPVNSVATSGNMFIRSTGHITTIANYVNLIPRLAKVLNTGGTATLVTGSKILIHEMQPPNVNS